MNDDIKTIIKTVLILLGIILIVFSIYHFSVGRPAIKGLEELCLDRGQELTDYQIGYVSGLHYGECNSNFKFMAFKVYDCIEENKWGKCLKHESNYYINKEIYT